MQALAALLLAATATAQDAARDPRPNIVLVYADDHAEAAVSAYGSKINRTPAIDRLASQGMLFRASFVGNAICGPARGTLLTGAHAHVHGKTTNPAGFDRDLPTFATELRAAGYQTAVVGKWHLPGDPVGFDHWRLIQGTYYGAAFRGPEGVERGEGHATERITSRAIDWMAEGRDPERPFLMWVSYKAAHRAWEPATQHLRSYDGVEIPEPPTLFDDYAGRSPGAAESQMRISRDLFPAYDLKLPVTGEGILDRAAEGMRSRMTDEEREAWEAAYGPRNEAFAEAKLEGDALVRWKYQRYIKDYLRCVDGLDEGLARISAFLDEAGLAESTVLIYTSDQGFFLGEHGWYDKRWMYEPALKTPMIVRWPGVVPPGSESDAMVQNIDVAPTLLEMAGVEVPGSVQGASLVPLLRGQRPAGWRNAIYYHYHQQDSGRTSHTVARHYGVRTARHKLIHVYDHGAWELFDLVEDPDEMVNLWADPEHAAVRGALERRLRALREQYGDEAGADF